MIGSVLRKAALITAVPALVAGASTAPAVASVKYDPNDDYNKSVKIRVCKDVKDDDYSNKDYKDNDKYFKIHVKTDRDYDAVRVRDGWCKSVYLDFKYPSFRVWEDHADGYEFLYIRCGDGAYSSGYNKCKFNKHDHQVKVTVVNKHVDHDDDDDEEEEPDD